MAVAILSAGCSSGGRPDLGADASAPAASVSGVPAIDPMGWLPYTYEALTAAIDSGSGSGKTVVFDMDNTVLARDVSEAVIGYAQETDALDTTKIPEELVPPVVVNGKTVSISSGPATYYEAVMHSGGDDDPYREFASLPLIADMFAGHTVAEFVQLTASAYDNGSAAMEFQTGQYETLAGMGRPVVYPQMADLLGNLRAHGYDVWIVSAAIGWSARWMILNAVNPMIEAKYGPEAKIPPDHVIAVFNLMRDRTSGEFVSDRQLIGRGDSAYLTMDPNRLQELEILSLQGDLTSWRGGKAGVIAQHVSDGPIYLAAGDSFGDMEMMDLAANRLVVARLNSPKLAAGYAEGVDAAPDATWMVQPVISTAPVGFVPSKCALAERTASDAALEASTAASLGWLEPTGLLAGFDDC